ncbi:MFS transporter [Saccharopolyspora rosea]|uniref:MFS transporter n=1 Tax=Saccharopolyspora rosea TaxID=524884 RepID=UPI0021D96F75|nr:MFS transporter [Saccharopolyspora rosea]
MTSRRDERPALTLTVMCAGMFLVLLDVTVVNVALPAIRADLHTSTAGMQWVVDAYAVTIAGLLLAAGAVGDRWGHRALVLAGLVLFGAASLGCALAPDVAVLVACRAAQGAAAAVLLPGSVALITRAYPQRCAQARALGVWSAVSSLALPAGPLLGGLLVQAVSWRAVFAVNVPVVAVPVVAVAVAVIARLVPAVPGDRSQRVRADALVCAVVGLTALVFAVVGLTALVFAVIETGRSGVDAVVGIAAGVAALAAAVLWSRLGRAASALVNRTFAAANAVGLIMNLCINGSLFVLTQYLQEVRGESAMRAGLLVLPLLVPLVVLAPVAGRMVARWGSRPPMVAGAAVAALGTACWLLATADGDYPRVLPVLVCCGIGAGLLTTALVAAAVGALPAERAGLASGVNNTARQTGTALGVAVFGALAGNPAARDAFTTGLHHAALLGAALWLIAVVLSTLVHPPTATSAQRHPTRQRART